MLISLLRAGGFSLIELLVAIAVMTIMLLLALPNFSIWMQNTQIRTAGEGILAGMQLARAEAVRRNTSVRFQLVNSLTSSCASAGFVSESSEVLTRQVAGLSPAARSAWSMTGLSSRRSLVCGK